ncbi:MAG: alpha/beta hydrolase [Anaeroplasmataceae bacterium]|nr:alpha/beta hydrolase [Anaeroplasmataceae bacterium]MDE6415237.1 alpha/beta hydrolase [Anaeroplasmataceae bacterium]
MIFIEIQNLKIHYEVIGSGKDLILLHGWGASLITFNKLAKTLSSNFKVYSIDLPGFGESQVGVPLGVEDVAEILHDFVIELGLDAPVLCGHSYGGRVAIIYASKFSVEKLVLISSAGLKQKLKFSKRFKVRIYKILKKCHIPVKMGSTDYQNADNVKRIMLVKAVNTDLKNELKLIAAPTLLLYGTKDTVTPLSLGYQMKQYIHNAELVELEECGHFPYLERPSIFAIILMSFLVGESDDH